MTKAALRRRMKAALAAIPAGELSRRGRLAADRLLATGWWSVSDTVLVYLAMPGELDTAAVVSAARASGKTIAAPVIESGELDFRVLEGDVAGLPRDRWGIPQPPPAWRRWDPASAAGGRVLVVVPGLAFDRGLGRLGRGRGYYDRLLARLRAASGLTVSAIGFCLAEQLVPAVPRDELDSGLDGIVSDREVVGP